MEIKVQNITKVIKGTTVLDSVSMEMKSGEIVGLRGENGSGKTMLMRMIAGLIFPTQGSVRIDGRALGKDLAFPKEMGILLENPTFLENYTGYQNLCMLASIQNRIGEEEIKKAIRRVGLEWNDKKKYRKYSLGMKQRLGIAAAIMEAPQLIILDEPSNALDAQGVEMLRKIIREEKERDALILVSSHDGLLLEEIADVIYIMKNGHLQTGAD